MTACSSRAAATGGRYGDGLQASWSGDECDVGSWLSLARFWLWPLAPGRLTIPAPARGPRPVPDQWVLLRRPMYGRRPLTARRGVHPLIRAAHSPAAVRRPEYRGGRALQHFFESDRDWLSRGLGGPNFGGRVYCAVDLLGQSPDGRELYVWTLCQEFYGTKSNVERGTGVSAPLRTTASAAVSDAATSSLSVSV